MSRFATKLHIFDVGVAAATGAQGNTSFAVRPTGGGNLAASLSTSEAAAAELTAGGTWKTYTVTANGELEVVMYSNNAAFTGAGYVEYAFSTPNGQLGV